MYRDREKKTGDTRVRPAVIEKANRKSAAEISGEIEAPKIRI
jgi:hypothetical protein